MHIACPVDLRIDDRERKKISQIQTFEVYVRSKPFMETQQLYYIHVIKVVIVVLRTTVHGCLDGSQKRSESANGTLQFCRINQRAAYDQTGHSFKRGSVWSYTVLSSAELNCGVSLANWSIWLPSSDSSGKRLWAPDVKGSVDMKEQDIWR